jgi:hypothetical protein
MSHIRKQIRDALVTAVTGLTTTGSRVYRSRVYPLESGKLPGLCVYTKSEEVTNSTLTRPRTQTRQLEASVEAYLMANTNFDDTLDTIAVEIEEAIYSNAALNALVKQINITGFEADYSGDGEKVVGVGNFNVQIIYSARENDIETAA